MNNKQYDFEILDLGLVYYKNVIDNSKELIDLIENINNLAKKDNFNNTSIKDWEPWKADTEEKMFCFQKSIYPKKDINPNDSYAKEQYLLADNLFIPLENALTHYKTQLYPFAEKNLKSREQATHLLKYVSGGFLPPHQDQGISTRILSVLIYLNDDYEGGEISFPHSNITLKPKAGSIIFFPSIFLYVHTISPMISGQRYALPTWYHNVPDSMRRDSNGEE